MRAWDFVCLRIPSLFPNQSCVSLIQKKTSRGSRKPRSTMAAAKNATRTGTRWSTKSKNLQDFLSTICSVPRFSFSPKSLSDKHLQQMIEKMSNWSWSPWWVLCIKVGKTVNTCSSALMLVVWNELLKLVYFSWVFLSCNGLFLLIYGTYFGGRARVT